MSLSAVGDGDLQAGGARYQGQIGEAEFLNGGTRWTPSGWSSQAQARLDAFPALDALARRIGASVTFEASGEHAGAFKAHGQTPFFAVDLRGRLTEAFELDGAAQITASAARLSDIVRETPFEFGQARFEGQLRQANGVTALLGELDAGDLDVLGQRARFAGSVEAALSARSFTLNADLRAADDAPPLFAAARLRAEMAYDRSRRRYELNRSTLEGEAVALDAQGWVNGDDGEFAGAWRVRRLDALAPSLRGAAHGRWRAFAEAGDGERIWVTSVDGEGERITGAPEIVPQALGARPRFDGLFRYEHGGITVAHARLSGTQARLGATGRIVQGQADLAIEASARGQLRIGQAEIVGALDAAGELTGPLNRPSLHAQAQLSSFAAPGVVVAQPRIAFTLAPAGAAYAGQARVDGAVAGQALVLTSPIAVTENAIALDQLEARVGALEARGRAHIGARGLSANLALGGAIDNLVAGASGAVEGQLTLTPDALALDARLTNARLGELRARTAAIEASGPLGAIDAAFSLDGRLRRAPLTFAGASRISISDEATSMRLEGRGALGGAELVTRAPMTLSWSRVGFDGAFDLALADGGVRGHWRERGRALSGAAHIDDAPLAPIAAIWDERASGRVDGEFRARQRRRRTHGQRRSGFHRRALRGPPARRARPCMSSRRSIRTASAR